MTSEAVTEYLIAFRSRHSASTYNGHVCVLREIFRVLAKKAGVVADPWEGVTLRTDDSISRRELALDGLHCVVCHNLGQARRMLESGESFAVICVIAQGTEA